MTSSSTASQHYHLRRHTHDRQLPTQTSHLCNKNFVTRALYKDCYKIPTVLVCIVYPELSGVLLRYVSFTNKE